MAINKNSLTKMLWINVNMSQWRLSQTSKWYHHQRNGIFEIPGWIYVNLRSHTSLLGILVPTLHYYGTEPSHGIFWKCFKAAHPNLRKGEPIQISEKLDLVTKTMYGYHGNNKSANFYNDFSENQQFYLVHAKLPIFLLFCLYTQNVEIK